MRAGGACVAIVLVAAAATVLHAQFKRPRAEVVPVVETASVAPGGEARLALKVTLPPKVHVQSDKPSDPSLIPTVLTLDLPKGLSVSQTVYPKSEPLKQEGVRDPLSVFGSEFTIRILLKVARDVAPGALVVPGRLRYQACDETTCFPPATAEAKWSLQVRRGEKQRPSAATHDSSR
jgi:DsbC/DsbD-like thiol-disulfide interchange protein